MPLLYSIYGLNLQANLPIPGLVTSPDAPVIGVQVLLGLMPPWLNGLMKAAEAWYVSPYLDESNEPVLRVWKLSGGDYFRLLYADGTEFVVDRLGTQVWATWPPSALTLEDTATYLLGPVLGFVLRLRGITCLHASAVAIGDQAIALLGPAGAGKSTTAAAFARSGYQVLSEDVVALDDLNDNFLVQPGYPLIRLWPESVNALYGDPEALPRLTPTWNKRSLDLLTTGLRFQTTPLPLAAIYFLDERSSDLKTPYVEPLPDNKKLMTLVANTYVSYLMDKQMRSAEFNVLGRVCERVALRRVTPHLDSAFLPELCRTIVDDFQKLNLAG